jgi:hypothetical protein
LADGVEDAGHFIRAVGNVGTEKERPHRTTHFPVRSARSQDHEALFFYANGEETKDE